MLEISSRTIKDKIQKDRYASFKKIPDSKLAHRLKRTLVVVLLLLTIMMFIPWTQNITGNGKLTSLRPDKRPQSIQSVIPGRIEKWYVSEGDMVKAGDTIMQISEIKDDYFDPNLLVNVEAQIKQKESSVSGYMSKVAALDRQIDAMNEGSKIKQAQQLAKIQQSQLKLQSDSIELIAAKANALVAYEQLQRFKELYNKGLKSESDLEQREVAMQNAKAKEVSSENDLLISRQELMNARAELNGIVQEYSDKIAKAESEKFSTMSALFETESQVTKMQSQYSGYNRRSGYYHITSPIDGYITRAIQTGVGETLKEGAEIVSLMPADNELAVEMYLRPMDYPLIRTGQKVRFVFDGWPAFVFSGWPGASLGTYGGTVVAIDNFTNEKGEYRILVAPDQQDASWPDGIRVGSGARGIALLNDVFLGYELWRQFNGFPPDFYLPVSDTEKTKK